MFDVLPRKVPYFPECWLPYVKEVKDVKDVKYVNRNLVICKVCKMVYYYYK